MMATMKKFPLGKALYKVIGIGAKMNICGYSCS